MAIEMINEKNILELRPNSIQQVTLDSTEETVETVLVQEY